MNRSSTRPVLHQWDIPDATSLPLPQQKRKITDAICIVIGLLFGIILFTVAVILYNKGNIQMTEYPTDYEGVICVLDAYDSTTKYPFLYFGNVNNPRQMRYCVADCPLEGVQPSVFKGNQKTGPRNDMIIGYYPTYPSSTNLGTYCLPTNENAKYTLLANIHLDKQFNAMKAIDYLFIGLAISFGLSLLWIILVQFLPKFTIWVIFILSAVLLIIASIIAFYGSGNHFAEDKGWAIFFGVVLILFFILLVYYVCTHYKQLQICSCFIDISTDCLKSNLSSLLFTLLFASLTVLFCVLLVFQYLAFCSYKTPVRDGIFYLSQKNYFLIFLLAIEAIWGLSFFRDAYNYVISGVASEWYFHRLNMCCYPFKRLFTKNFGSVVGGSLLSGLFYIPALIISFLTPRQNCCFCNLFDLARSDVYTYIYLTGNSYCPSSRHVQYLCYRSRICRQNESVLTIFSLFSRIVISLCTVLFVYWITRDNLVDEKVPMLQLIGVFVLCLYFTSYFSDIHIIMAQALMICFLTEYDLEQGWSFKEMRSCPQRLSKLIIDIQSNNHHN